MSEEEKKLTIPQIIEKACEKMCENYCKWPEKWDPEEHDGQELWDSEICGNCHLYRLI